MRKWKWLFVNGCEWIFLFILRRVFLKFLPPWDNSIVCLGIVLKTGGLQHSVPGDCPENWWNYSIVCLGIVLKTGGTTA